jgi:hypothetical protein
VLIFSGALGVLGLLGTMETGPAHPIPAKKADL